MVKVLVVDDSLMMRTTIKDIVSSDPELSVVGTANNGEEALEVAKKLTPDVILLDIEMPVLNGIDCLKRLKLLSRAKVIIVTSLKEDDPKVQEARRLGVLGVVCKPSGAMSLDLKSKKGHEIVGMTRRAAGLGASYGS